MNALEALDILELSQREGYANAKAMAGAAIETLRQYTEWQPMETLPNEPGLQVLVNLRKGRIFSAWIDQIEPEIRLCERWSDYFYYADDFSGWRRI